MVHFHRHRQFTILVVSFFLLTMIGSNTIIRRLIVSRLLGNRPLRSYHASRVLGADALDMTDTFARRHGKSKRGSTFKSNADVTIKTLFYNSTVASRKSLFANTLLTWIAFFIV